jgi:DNA-binding MarR family transcriptional regulator
MPTVQSPADLAAELRPRLMRLSHMLRRQTLELSLTMTQSAVLGRLLAGRPLRVSELAQSEGVQLPTMTQILSRMEEQGLVKRQVAAQDRRCVEVSILPRGEELARQVTESRNALLQRQLSGLSQEELDALAAAIPALDSLLR